MKHDELIPEDGLIDLGAVTDETRGGGSGVFDGPATQRIPLGLSDD